MNSTCPILGIQFGARKRAQLPEVQLVVTQSSVSEGVGRTAHTTLPSDVFWGVALASLVTAGLYNAGVRLHDFSPIIPRFGSRRASDLFEHDNRCFYLV